MVNQRQPFNFTAHHGIQYRIPNTLENIGLELLINGVYERDVITFLQKNIRDGDLYFDVGANIGADGLPVCIQKKNMRYYGFEASNSTFLYLKENFEANKIKQAALIHAAVLDKEGEELPFYESDWHGKNSFAPVYSQTFSTVQTISLDSFCRNNAITTINFLKLDVQGFEIKVLQGAKSLLEDGSIKAVLFEFEAWAEASAGFTPGAAQEFIMSMGYKMYRLNGVPISVPLSTGEEMIYAIPAGE